MLSRIEPANSTGRCPIQAVSRDSACGTSSAMSAPLMVTRPLSGRTNPSRISITVDLPAPEGPASTSVSPAGTRKLRPSSAGPRAGSQVRCTSSNATVTPLRRDGADVAAPARGVGGGRQVDQRVGRARGVQPVLIGGGEATQRGEELRHQQQREQRRVGPRQPRAAATRSP